MNWGSAVAKRTYDLADGRKICVVPEFEAWTAWIEGSFDDSVTHGFPLEGILAEAVGLNPAHDDIPVDLVSLAAVIRSDFGVHYTA
jgi:hypothetical protein